MAGEEREVNDHRYHFAIKETEAPDKIQVNLHLSNLRNIQAQSVKASYAQSLRSLPSSLTEAFSTLPRFVSGKDRNRMRKKNRQHAKGHKNP